MKKKIILLFLLLNLFILSGCYTYSVVASYDSDSVVPEKTTQWSYIWGLVKPKDKKSGCTEESISKFTVKTNLGYQIISIITAGLVVPIQIEWYCSPENMGVTPLPDDNENDK